MKEILTAEDVRATLAAGRRELAIGDDTILTDAAHDLAQAEGLRLVRAERRQLRQGAIQIELAGEVIPAELLFDHAPRTCRAIEAVLPLHGTANHARLAGDEIMFPIRTYIEPENQSKSQELGNIAYWPDRMVVCVFYAPTGGVGLTNVFGRVTGNLDGLKRAGDALWKRQGLEMTIRRG